MRRCIVAAGFVALVSCSGSQAVPASSSTTSAGATTAEVTTTAPAVATTESTLAAAPDCSPCLEVVDLVRSGDRVQFTVLDHRGRNLAQKPTTAWPSSTLDPRPIYVVAFVPSTDGPHTLVVTGDYRNGPEPLSASRVTTAPTDFIDVHVGFAKMAEGKADYTDIVNHPGDISAVLDVLEADSSIVGAVDTSNVQYRGHSMGAISGYFFANSCCLDPRITSAVLMSGDATSPELGFYAAYDWAAGPRILAVNGTLDTVIPYQMARRFLEPALGYGTVTVLTVLTSNADNGHAPTDGSCPAVASFIEQWAAALRLGTAVPSVPTESCLTEGFVEGGTDGYGSAGSFVVPP